jgi:hypothetical protein
MDGLERPMFRSQSCRSDMVMADKMNSDAI